VLKLIAAVNSSIQKFSQLINRCRIFYNNGYKINTEFDGRPFGLARRRYDQRQLDDRAPASLPDVSFRRHDNAKANVTSLGDERPGH